MNSQTASERQELARLRAVEEELRESEARYRSIVESAFDAIITIDHEDRITEFNPAAEALFGRRRADVIGRDLAETIIPPALRDGHRAGLRRHRDSASAPRLGVRLQLPALRADGSEFPIELTVSRVAGAGLPQFTAIIRELTPASAAGAQGQYTAALRTSESQYRTLFADSPLPIVVYEPHTLRFIAANAAALAQYGYSHDEFLGMTIDMLRPPGEREGWRRQTFASPLEGVHHYRGQHCRKDGSLFHMEAVANDIVFQGRAARLVLVMDVTQQRESQRMLASLMGNLPGMAYRCRNEPDWPLDFVSEGAHALTGHRPDMLTSGAVPYGNLVHPDDRQAVWDEVQRAIAHDEPFEMTYRITAASGEVKWVWERGSAVRGAAGDVVALEGFISDVTETRRAQDEVARLNAELEERVRQRTAQLEAANADLEAFAYSIAHDLRSPLTSIDGFSQSLEALCGDALPETGKHYLRRIRAGVRQMSDLTDAMLSLARLSRVQLRWDPVDLAAAARDAIDLLRERHPRTKLVLEVPARLPAQGDPRLLAQVMANLVGNAWKFSAHKPQTEIRIGTTTGERGETVYFVADRGAGFDMAHASRLFGAFQRLHSPSEFEGTGIGLALVQKIVHRHGGLIWAEAKPGEGATFYFTLANAPSP